ncbi:MAG: hypothetical protein ACOVO1_00125 [Chitinophagaceae bacterium]
MNQFKLLFVILSISLFSCKKDPVINEPIVKKIKQVSSTSTDSKMKSVTKYFFDSSQNLKSIVYTEIDTTTSVASVNIIRTINFQYTNNLPTNTTIVTYQLNPANATPTGLSNTFNRQFIFDAQNRIVLDSLVSMNMQYAYTGNSSFKDTIAYLTNRAVSYSGTNQYTNFYNSHLLGNSFVWVYDSSSFINGNLVMERNTSFASNKYVNFTKNATFTSYNNPLFTGLTTQFGQSQNLPSQETYTYSNINIPITYQYTVDAVGTVLSSIQNSFNSTTAAPIVITSYYEYY